MVPVGFFSRKLAKGQLNWTPREKETYAVVSALQKWAGWIGLQKVVVKSDHKSLENWVQEKRDTPSGPAGRRARWHEILSKFDLEVQYVPGKENVVADAMSRFAYPACKAWQDTSMHGSNESREEMKEIIATERDEEKSEAKSEHTTDGRIIAKAKAPVSETKFLMEDREVTVSPITRSGRRYGDGGRGDEADKGQVVYGTGKVGKTKLRVDAPPFIPRIQRMDEAGNEVGGLVDGEGRINMANPREGGCCDPSTISINPDLSIYPDSDPSITCHSEPQSQASSSVPPCQQGDQLASERVPRSECASPRSWLCSMHRIGTGIMSYVLGGVYNGKRLILLEGSGLKVFN